MSNLMNASSLPRKRIHRDRRNDKFNETTNKTRDQEAVWRSEIEISNIVSTSGGNPINKCANNSVNESLSTPMKPQQAHNLQNFDYDDAQPSGSNSHDDQLVDKQIPEKLRECMIKSIVDILLPSSEFRVINDELYDSRHASNIESGRYGSCTLVPNCKLRMVETHAKILDKESYAEATSRAHYIDLISKKYFELFKMAEDRRAAAVQNGRIMNPYDGLFHQQLPLDLRTGAVGSDSGSSLSYISDLFVESKVDELFNQGANSNSFLSGSQRFEVSNTHASRGAVIPASVAHHYSNVNRTETNVSTTSQLQALLYRNPSVPLTPYAALQNHFDDILSAHPQLNYMSRYESIDLQLEDAERRGQVQNYIMILLHSKFCPKRNEGRNDARRCKVPLCGTLKKVLKHVTRCLSKKNCSFEHCYFSKMVIVHWKVCALPDCMICVPLKELIKSRKGVTRSEELGEKQILHFLRSQKSNCGASGMSSARLISGAPSVEDSVDCGYVKMSDISQPSLTRSRLNVDYSNPGGDVNLQNATSNSGWSQHNLPGETSTMTRTDTALGFYSPSQYTSHFNMDVNMSSQILQTYDEYAEKFSEKSWHNQVNAVIREFMVEYLWIEWRSRVTGPSVSQSGGEGNAEDVDKGSRVVVSNYVILNLYRFAKEAELEAYNQANSKREYYDRVQELCFQLSKELTMDRFMTGTSAKRSA